MIVYRQESKIFIKKNNKSFEYTDNNFWNSSNNAISINQKFKNELIKRYKYLYENITFILAVYMHEVKDEELNNYKKKYKINLKENIIYLKDLDREILLSLEDFMFSGFPMESLSFYKQLEENKKDRKYLDKVNDGIRLLKVKNNKEIYNFFEEKFDLSNILIDVKNFINMQVSDLLNKELKLEALEEYFKIYRYSNTDKSIEGIYNTNTIKKNRNYFNELNFRQLYRKKNDVGIVCNNFIKYLSNPKNKNKDNHSILTEDEKQQIYLNYHNELPWNLMITCAYEDKYIPFGIDTRLARPDNTSPCNEVFRIKEEEIFIDKNDEVYRYYQVCPRCGYIVHIPKEILSNDIRKRIEDKCYKDPNLFRKMYLYSELKKLEDNSLKGQKRLLRK